MSADRPTPPPPKMMTDDPGSTLALLNTAPTPVVTAQPTRQAASMSASASRTTHDLSSTTAWRAKVERYE